MAMSLDGLRAWIGVVERKLTMRTRVFLVLVAIAIGGAAAGIVLAIDAQDNAVSKDDLQAVRDELAGTSPVAPTAEGEVSELKAEVEALQSEVAALKATGGSGKSADEGPREGPAGAGGTAPPAKGEPER
jgi:hypothetical protein